MNFITARLAPPDPKNDGKQTPMRGHPVFIAQHATATCCCGQLEKWYQIEKGKALDDDEVGYVVNLVMECREGQIQSLYPEISIFYGHVSTGNVKYSGQDTKKFENYETKRTVCTMRFADRRNIRRLEPMELSERLVNDYYEDGSGNIVFTERYLIRIRSCCGNGCRHCPYEPKHMGGSKQIRDELNKMLNNRM